MKRYLGYLPSLTVKNGAYALIAVALLAAGYLMFTGGEAQEETMVAARGTFVQAVSASGKVVPARDVELGFTQGGRISRVNVAVGQRVAAGTTLASTDSSDVRANLSQREAALETEKARLAALQEGPRPEEIAVKEAAVASDRVKLAQANDALVDAMRDAYAEADEAVRVFVYQFVSNPRGTNPQINVTSSASQSTVDLAASVIRIESTLTAWGSAQGSLSGSDADIRQAQESLSEVSKLLALASAVLNQATPSQSITQATIDAYIADVAAARASINSVSSSLTTAITARKNAVSALDASEKNLALTNAGSLQADINAQAARVRAAEADVENVRAQIAKTVIAAPFTGVITRVDAKAGAIASANESLIAMIGADTFQIESYVPEINIAQIAVGNPATIVLDAYGDEVVFDARVVTIDPAETVRDGVATYRVILQFTVQDERIRSGMTANIVITAFEREDVLAIPQGLIIEREGKKYVRIKEGEETIIEREVTTGAVSSYGTIEILSGVSAGDTLVVKAAE